ncbi:MAG: hypothetical protein H0V29_00860 [Thermoleophilaceae bacterium]|nr:hypothetical protein [Thermoleophilaceae bacterium]
MSTEDTKHLIERTVEKFGDEVPSLKQLKLVLQLELNARGDDAPIWRVETPGPTVSKEPAGDARIEISVGRSHFNELAKDGTLKHWKEAFDNGHVRVAGDTAVVKLVGNVIERQLARSRA